MNNTALLIIDFVNDIVHPEGKIATAASFIQKNNIIENTNRLIEFARRNKILPLFVKVGFSTDYQECPTNSPVFGKIKDLQALQHNTWGTEFHEKLAFLPEDTVVLKHRVSAFYGTSLEIYLRTQRIDTLLLSGVSTNMTIASTAREAHDRDYSVVIVEDACAAATEEIQQNCLALLSRVAQITTVAQLTTDFS